MRHMAVDEPQLRPSHLKQLREQAGVSQRAFENALGFGHGYLSKVESGKEKPSGDLVRLYRELGAGTPLEELRRETANKAPGPSSRRGAVITSADVGLVINDDGVLHRIFIRLSLRAGRRQVDRQRLVRLPVAEEDEWGMEILEGDGKLARGRRTARLRDYGVKFWYPLSPGEEHYVHALFEPAPSTIEYLVQRLEDFDVRHLVVRLWIPLDIVDRFTVRRVDGLSPRDELDHARLPVLRATANGLVRTEFRSIQPSWRYGIIWTVSTP
jgi:transcriptional regulator with XRE-family HTH domain